MTNLIRETRDKAAPSSDPTRFLWVRGKYVVPLINAPGQPESLLLQYPLDDQSSYYRENRRRIWGYKPTNRVWDEDIISEIAARSAHEINPC